MGESGGIFPTLVGTILLPLLAIAIALPLGMGTAIYLTEYTRASRVTRVIRFGTDCLAGIPSIIFGLFGFIFFVTDSWAGLVAVLRWIDLAVMILPTIIRTAEEAIKAVPNSYREVSFSLGATRWRTCSKWSSQRITRHSYRRHAWHRPHIGETAAVIFTAGTSLRFPTSLFDSSRTMAVHFYILDKGRNFDRKRLRNSGSPDSRRSSCES